MNKGYIVVNNEGVTTIENVRREFDGRYEKSHSTMTKLLLKAWKYSSEIRNERNEQPFSFVKYFNNIQYSELIEQVELGVIEVEDIGGKEKIIELINSHSRLDGKR